MAFFVPFSLLVLLASAAYMLWSPTPVLSPPTVVLDTATVIGHAHGTVNSFLGLPFAQPPVGHLRLRLPQPVSPYTGIVNATAYGNQCIQQTFPPLAMPSELPAAVYTFFGWLLGVPDDIPQAEDCLNLNVIVPANTPSDAKLPVAVWIYGGANQLGSNAMRPGENVVARSIEIGHPIIFVAMNYRLSAFGFLGGKEVKEAGLGNLGLHDQREALRWIQKYIPAFGGDPTKVMIWGESAGAAAVSLQMLYNGGDTEGLFRAGFLQSGAPPPTGWIDDSYPQSTYDGFVADAGCADAPDTLSCLRTVPVTTFKAAMDKTPSPNGYKQINAPYFSRADGVFITAPPQQLFLSGAVANIPIVSGNDLDEGTVLSFPTLNITTDEESLEYINSNFYSHTSRDAVSKILDFYSSDPAEGCPFGTGDAFAYSPQYKRMSAFQGDFVLNAPSRTFVQYLSERQPVYSFLSNISRVDGIGAAHGTELANVFGGGNMGDYLIRFAATLDPNGDGAFHWPRYTVASPQLLKFSDSSPTLDITLDTFRAEEMAYLAKLSLADPL